MFKEMLIQSAITLLIPLFIFFYPIGENDTEAYFFPRLLGWSIFAFLALHWLFYLFKTKKETKNISAVFPFKTVFIYLLILTGGIAVIETIGFYVTSFILYSTIALVNREDNSQIKAIFISAFVFLTILYLLFRIILLVQTPSGYFF